MLECNLVWMLINHTLWLRWTFISAFIFKCFHFKSLKVCWYRSSFTQLLWLSDIHYHLRFGSWLGRMGTFALYCPEISCLLLFQANHCLHSKLTCVNILLILKTHFRNDHASRCNSVILACFLLQNTDCCRVGSTWLRWIRHIIAAAFGIRATPLIRASPPPVGAMTAVHYYLLL